MASPPRWTKEKFLSWVEAAVSRLDNVLAPAASGRNRAEQVESLIASK